MIVAFVLFFLAGLGFGYAAPGIWKFLPLLFPLALALPAFARDGFHGNSVGKFILALALSFAGVLIGAALDAREERGSASPA